MSFGSPHDVVDCDAEARRLDELLTFVTQRRIMTVSDDSGWGKSTFLRKLHHLCRWRHGVPVALVPLEDYEDRPDEFALVTDLVAQLKESELRFPSFDELTLARSFHDVAMFANNVHGTANANGAVINESIIAGTMYKIENVEQFNRFGAPDWTDEADRQAKLLCVEAFFTELLDAARKSPLVIMFDTVESAHEKLKDWLFLALVKRRVLADPDGHKLVIVLAGKKLEADLRSRFLDYDSFFESILSLGIWDLEDTARLFEVRGFDKLLPEDVHYLHAVIVSRNMSLIDVLAIADIINKKRIAGK